MYLLVNYQIHVHFWLVEEIISPKKKKQEGELKASSLRINPLHFLSGCGGSNGPQSGRSPPLPQGCCGDQLVLLLHLSIISPKQRLRFN